MLKLILGTDWKKNTSRVFKHIAYDVSNKLGGRILLVPESISHNTERQLCEHAGATASRFAEVLSFSRLPDRLCDASGSAECACMDNGGRVVAMASAALQLHSKLKAYASVETKPEFLINLLDAIDEFKCCCIHSADLMKASRLSQGSLAQKLEELSLLLEAYDSLCHQGSRDPRDKLTWLLEQLEDSSFGADHVFYLNGFSDFTGQQLEIVKHFIAESKSVVVSLNCDNVGSLEPAFEKAGETAALLIRFAKEADVAVKIETVEPDDSILHTACAKLFKGTLQQDPAFDPVIRLYQTDSVADECNAAAMQVMERIHAGARYRDIRIVCSDISVYSNALRMSFIRYGIPLYISGTEDILDMPIINTVLSALEAATCGFEQKTVMRYLRSYLSPLDTDTCDRVENYAYTWNIRGDRWKKAWTNHPDGLGKQVDDKALRQLGQLNAAREKTFTPLIRLEERFRKALSVREQVTAIYEFLEDIRLAERLEQMASLAAQTGENATIQVFGQLWEILVNAMEQLYDVLGHTAWDTENFTKLLKLLLSQYSVGTIPPVLDAVTVGSVASMRCQPEKHLIVLGALEGALPSYGSSSGVLTEQERAQLRLLGVPLSGGAMDGLRSEFADIYNIFCGANESITVSCPAGQPSYIYRRLLTMVGKERPVDICLGAAEYNVHEAGAFVVRAGSLSDARKLNIENEYREVLSAAEHTLGSISQDTVRALYGDTLLLSASKIDQVADCRLSYFLKYGLRARERKMAVIDPAAFGTYIHDILENTAREIKELGGFHNVSLEETLQIANKYAEAYSSEHFVDMDSERLNYLFQRNAKELEMIVTDLWDELQNSEFEPFDFELCFGEDGKADFIHFAGKRIQALMQGRIDRVDLWNNGHQNYYRVVDYKTGKENFDYCDVFNGRGLQMLLYMFALEEGRDIEMGEHPVPAGVQYFPANVPIISTDGVMTEEELKLERAKLLSRKGLLLEDDAVLRAMEPFDKPVRMDYSRKKDGTLSGDLADRGQMKLLKAYIYKLLGNIVDDIASGCVDPNPYTRGTAHNACRFCPYGAVCHPQYVDGRREYKAMDAKWFWEAVGKEMEVSG